MVNPQVTTAVMIIRRRTVKPFTARPRCCAADLYRIEEPHRAELLALAREANSTRWIEEPAITEGYPYPEGYAAYMSAEVEASTLWNWEPQVIPGLLQTESYAREVMRGWHSMFSLSPTLLDIRVETRIKRQQVLTRDHPLDLTVVMHESIIRRRFGDDFVMRRQLDLLIETSEMPNVEMRVLPLDGMHPIGTGSFIYMQFPQVHEVPLHDIVIIGEMASNYYIEDIASTNQYRVAFENLRANSLDPSASRELIVRTTNEMWS